MKILIEHEELYENSTHAQTHTGTFTTVHDLQWTVY